MAKEFMDFVTKYGVIGLAIGVVTGGAVKALVDSIVLNLLSPLVGLVTGGVNLSALTLIVGKAELKYGLFLNDLISFLAIMLVVFFIIKFFIGKFMSDDEHAKI